MATSVAPPPHQTLLESVPVGAKLPVAQLQLLKVLIKDQLTRLPYEALLRHLLVLLQQRAVTAALRLLRAVAKAGYMCV